MRVSLEACWSCLRTFWRRLRQACYVVLNVWLLHLFLLVHLPSPVG
jgi:hypothetical protein